MSPWKFKQQFTAKRFPRVSGDEPGHCAGLLAPNEFSPRERG